MARADIAGGVKNRGANTKAFFTHCRGRISWTAATNASATPPVDAGFLDSAVIHHSLGPSSGDSSGPTETMVA